MFGVHISVTWWRGGGHAPQVIEVFLNLFIIIFFLFIYSLFVSYFFGFILNRIFIWTNTVRTEVAKTAKVN